MRLKWYTCAGRQAGRQSNQIPTLHFISLQFPFHDTYMPSIRRQQPSMKTFLFPIPLQYVVHAHAIRPCSPCRWQSHVYAVWMGAPIVHRSTHTHTFLHPSTHIPAMIPLPYKIDDCEPFPFCVPNITILNEFLFSRVFDVNANGSFTIGCTNVADDVAVVLPMVMCYDIRSEETARRARIGQRRLNKQRPQIFQFTTIAKTPRMFRWHFTPPPMMDLIISKRYCCAYCHTYW